MVFPTAHNQKKVLCQDRQTLKTTIVAQEMTRVIDAGARLRKCDDNIWSAKTLRFTSGNFCSWLYDWPFGTRLMARAFGTCAWPRAWPACTIYTWQYMAVCGTGSLAHSLPHPLAPHALNGPFTDSLGILRTINAIALKRHMSQFFPCQERAMYALSDSCGAVYVGQTGWCVNERLW